MSNGVRFVGKDPDGIAKAISVNDDGVLLTELSRSLLVGEVAENPTANTLLARLKSLEDKIDILDGVLDSIVDGSAPAVTQLSGSIVTIGATTFAVSGGDTLRGKAVDRPDAVAAHAVIPFCYYFSVDTGVVEVTDGTSWVVI